MERSRDTSRAMRGRLAGYWRMEAGNIILLPALGIYLLHRAGGHPGPLSLLSIAAAILLLAVGAAYWRGKLRQLEGHGWPGRALAFARAARLPALLLCVAAVAAAAASWAWPGIATGPGERWLASGFALLATLEYVNYYHRQLQHFDRLNDLRRLVTGRGFRRAQLAQDLRRG